MIDYKEIVEMTWLHYSTIYRFFHWVKVKKSSEIMIIDVYIDLLEKELKFYTKKYL